MSQCSICLSNYRDPVCIPCGHVYCRNCIKGHANGSRNNALTAKCPDCRAEFHLTVPDLIYLPEKYHPFVSHPVRRVYIDTAASSSSSSSSQSTSALETALKAAQTRLAAKDASEEQLMRRCEELLSALDAHRQGEREANVRIMDMDAELTEKQSLLKKNEERVKELEKLNAVLTSKIKSHEKLNETLKAENLKFSMNLQRPGSELTEITTVNSELTVASPKQLTLFFEPSSENTAPLPLSPLKLEQPARLLQSKSDTTEVDQNDLSLSVLRSPQRAVKPIPKRRVPRKSADVSKDRPSAGETSMTLAKIF